MAKGQFLTNHQKGIVNRYYEHLDTISLTKIAEACSELYLTTDAKKTDKLWKTVETALAKLAAKDTRARVIVAKRDIKGLAQLVSELSGKK